MFSGTRNSLGSSAGPVEATTRNGQIGERRKDAFHEAFLMHVGGAQADDDEGARIDPVPVKLRSGRCRRFLGDPFHVHDVLVQLRTAIELCGECDELELAAAL